MSLDRHPNVDPAIAAAAAHAFHCRTRLDSSNLPRLARRMDHVIYSLNYIAYTARFEPLPNTEDIARAHGPPPPGILARIVLTHPETSAPRWIQQWNGHRVATLWSQPKSYYPLSPAEDLDSWGGYTWGPEWEDKFRAGNPVDIAPEIVDCQRGAGLDCHFLPPGEPA